MSSEPFRTSVPSKEFITTCCAAVSKLRAQVLVKVLVKGRAVLIHRPYA